MKLQYLGTAAAEGWPGLFCDCEYCETARKLGGRNLRTRSQSVVYSDVADTEGTLLIDLSPDTYMHCLMYGLRLDKVGHMLVTHSHNDHFTPDELQYRMEWYAGKKDFPLCIYGNETVRDKYRRAMNSVSLTDEQVNIIFHEVEFFKVFQAGRFTVTPLKAAHSPSESCMLYIVENDGKTILYAHDTGLLPEETWSFIQGRHFDIVSLDCTYGNVPDGGGHMGLAENVKTKNRLASLGCIDETSRVILNHFSHNGALYYDAMREAASVYGLEVSYDGAVWDV